MMVGRLLSYWEGNFSGAMSNFGRVSNDIYPTRSSKICQTARPLLEERLAKPPTKNTETTLKKKNRHTQTIQALDQFRVVLLLRKVGPGSSYRCSYDPFFNGRKERSNSGYTWMSTEVSN